MVIYFVNKYSRIKGPYDILDSKRNRIIGIGDICIREQRDVFVVLLVVSDVNNWNSCALLGRAESNLGLTGNKMLFSYNGTSQRQGCKECLEQLSCSFENTFLQGFFKNTLEILQYKCDFWEALVLEKIYTFAKKESLEGIKSNVEDSKNSKRPMYSKFLSGDAAGLFDLLYSQSANLKYIYREIKNKYPQEFRRAITAFLEENPDKTIFDK